MNFYHGGLAEIVAFPSKITIQHFANWFTGDGSVGKAMELLKLPYVKTSLPIFKRHENQFVVDISHEEKTLYSNTMFRYKHGHVESNQPPLIVDMYKLLSPRCVWNTLRLIFIQSLWIARPQDILTTLERLLDDIPEKSSINAKHNVEMYLKDTIWPVVIAIGAVSEYFTQLIIHTSNPSTLAHIQEYIAQEIAQKDWVYRSIADQQAVCTHSMDFDDYLKTYGLRADDDYELTCPRWYEIPRSIEKRIAESLVVPEKKVMKLECSPTIKKYIDASIRLSILRSEAKRKALIYVDVLRQQLLSSHTITDVYTPKIVKHSKPYSKKMSGMGTPISQGTVSGPTLQITRNDMTIPRGTIGIFPNASPHFAPQYQKCAGMIFLRGGITSHGAIVAREFQIPAIVDAQAEGIADNSTIVLDATEGTWKIG